MAEFVGNFIIIPVPDFHLHETGLLYGHSTFPAASDLSENGVELIYLFLSSCVLAGGFWLATFADWTLPQVKAEADWRLWLGAAAVLILVEAVVFY